MRRRQNGRGNCRTVGITDPVTMDVYIRLDGGTDVTRASFGGSAAEAFDEPLQRFGRFNARLCEETMMKTGSDVDRHERIHCGGAREVPSASWQK